MSRIVDEFRAGLKDGGMLIQKCEACGQLMLYPRHRCIGCGSDALGWQKATGRGSLHSYTVVRAVPPAGFEDELPYGLGIVKLEEGVQLLARLKPQDGDWSAYHCGGAVRLVAAPDGPDGERPVAWFEVAAE
jgi:uncharacterized OB-fold protein